MENQETQEHSKKAEKMIGLKAEPYFKQLMLRNTVKTIKMYEKTNFGQEMMKWPKGAVPSYVLNREGQSGTKVLSNMIKQKWK